MKSFKDIDGNNVRIEDVSELSVDTQTDILSDEVTAYLVYCGDYRYEVSERVYNAIAELIQKL